MERYQCRLKDGAIEVTVITRRLYRTVRRTHIVAATLNDLQRLMPADTASAALTLLHSIK